MGSFNGSPGRRVNSSFTFTHDCGRLWSMSGHRGAELPFPRENPTFHNGSRGGPAKGRQRCLGGRSARYCGYSYLICSQPQPLQGTLRLIEHCFNGTEPLLKRLGTGNVTFEDASVRPSRQTAPRPKLYHT